MYTQFFILFGIIFTGYFLRKIRFLKETMDDGLNKFIVYFAYPCLLVYNIGTMSVSKRLMEDFILMLAVSLLMFSIYGIYTYGYGKCRRFPSRISNVAEVAMTMPNNGFMGFPIAIIFFGTEGFILMMAHNIVFNVFCFSYCIEVLRRNNEGKEKISGGYMVKLILKILLNPNILAVAFGFVVMSMGISLDNAIGTYLKTVGGLAAPMAMISIGAMLAGSKFLEMFKNRIVWESSMNKLIILPCLTILIMWSLPLPPLVKSIAVLGCCFPTAATVNMLAQQEKQNVDVAGKILFFTTVISMGTIPVFIKIINLLFS